MVRVQGRRHQTLDLYGSIEGVLYTRGLIGGQQCTSLRVEGL